MKYDGGSNYISYQKLKLLFFFFLNDSRIKKECVSKQVNDLPIDNTNKEERDNIRINIMSYIQWYDEYDVFTASFADVSMLINCIFVAHRRDWLLLDMISGRAKTAQCS